MTTFVIFFLTLVYIRKASPWNCYPIKISTILILKPSSVRTLRVPQMPFHTDSAPRLSIVLLFGGVGRTYPPMQPGHAPIQRSGKTGSNLRTAQSFWKPGRAPGIHRFRGGYCPLAEAARLPPGNGSIGYTPPEGVKLLIAINKGRKARLKKVIQLMANLLRKGRIRKKPFGCNTFVPYPIFVPKTT